ncbi:hypothetical protein ACWCYY_34585 [Kitasatospora sp. NPDC001664]
MRIKAGLITAGVGTAALATLGFLAGNVSASGATSPQPRATQVGAPGPQATVAAPQATVAVVGPQATVAAPRPQATVAVVAPQATVAVVAPQATVAAEAGSR